MEAMIRRALGGTFDAFAASSKNTISKQTALGRQLGARQASTAGVSTRAYAPWQQRTAQQSRSGTRGYSQFTSPLRWKSSPKRSFHTSKARKSPGAASGAKENIPEVSLSLSQRLKKLSREYGWSAVGVYLTFSILDFPFCFLLVRMVGVDKIAAVEHYVVSNVKQLIPENVREWWHDYRAQMKQASREKLGEEVTQNVEMAGWGVEEAEQKNKSQASLGTQLALAYAIHKSFIFLRVPLTAAVTPKVVKVLRGWGWQIGKRTSKAAKEAVKAAKDAKK